MQPSFPAGELADRAPAARILFVGPAFDRRNCANLTAVMPPGAGIEVAFTGTMITATPIHQFPVVRQFMTPAPHTIGPTRSLAVARHMMQEHGIRHLPVLDGGRIVGLLSERDLLLVETVPNVNPTNVRVEEAMVQEVLTVEPDTPVAEVVERMLERKAGSAVVCDGDRVVGVFTTIDALAALHELLERP
jgi:acetoin utilization protein AcuB